MTRTMGDSVDITQIPKTVDLIATYVSGHEGVVPAAQLEELFPAKKYFRVTIDVNGTRPDANVRDWETGDKSGDLEQWVIDHNKHSGKKDAVIYCNRSTIAEVRQQTKSQVLGVDYFLWISTLDGTIYRVDGVIACQNLGSRQLGRNWDSSVVFDDKFWVLSTPPVVIQVPSKAKPDCTAFQRAIRVQVDNMWGVLTDNAAQALIQAWSGNFPEGVVFTQHTVGVKNDGVWGPDSKQAMRDTTAHAQRALNSMGFTAGAVDGVWGPNTQKAYNAARKACHI